MEYSFKDLFESAYQGKTTTYPKEKTKRRNKPESIEEKNEKIHEEKNTRKVQEKALVQLDRSLKKKFEKEFDFKIDFHDIKDGFIIIGSNPKTSQTGEQLSTTSSVYRYNIFNDSLINLKKLESSKSISFLAALEIHNSVLICYNNDDWVIFDYLKEVDILKFNEKKLIKNVITEQGLKKIFFTTEFDLWEWNPLESLPKIKYLNFLEGPIKHIDKIKEVNIFLFLTEAGQMKAYIHTSQQISEIRKFSAIKVKRFMLMKESQILILETSEKMFQIWKVQVDYDCFKQRFTENFDWKYSDNIEENSQEPNIEGDREENQIANRPMHEIARPLNNLPDNEDQPEAIPLKLKRIHELQLTFEPNLWDFCDSSNILFLTQKSENMHYIYCFFTHNNDAEQLNPLNEDKSLTGMKICQKTQWMILKSSQENKTYLKGVNLSKTGFHPFGRHEHIIDVFFDENTDMLYTCSSDNIKKWNMSTHKRIQSKPLFEDGITKVISYQFCVKTKVIFFSTTLNVIGSINALTLENQNDILLNVSENNFKDKTILMRINNQNSSLILAVQSLPYIGRWEINNNRFYSHCILTYGKKISDFHISPKHKFIIVFFIESPEIHFYDMTTYELKKELPIFKPLPLNFIFESEEHNHLYIGVNKLILILDLKSPKEIKQVPIKNTGGYQISKDYLLINSEHSTSVNIWSLKSLSLVCELENFYFNKKQILIYKLVANWLFIVDNLHYLFQKFTSNNTQNISFQYPLDSKIRKPKHILRLFENHLQKYIFSKNEFQINDFTFEAKYQAILHGSNNNSIVVIYKKNFDVWQIEPWSRISKNEIKEGDIFYYALFNDDQNKFLMVTKSEDNYYFKIYQLLPFELCINSNFVEKLKIWKFIVNTKTQFAYFSNSQYHKVYQFNFTQSGTNAYTELYSFSHTIKEMMISENQNWLFVVMMNPITVVYDLKNNVILKTIEDNNCFRKVVLLDSKNILVSIEKNAYTIWEVSTLRLIGKFEFTKHKRTLHKPSPQSSVKDIISIKIMGKKLGQFISIDNYSEINNLSFSEEIFLSNMLLNEYTSNQFVQSFRETKHIYESSLVLKKYFNIYLLAVMSDNEKTFETLFEDDKVPFEFNTYQINPVQFLLAKDQKEKLKFVLNFIEKKQVHLPIDRKSFELLLNEQENFIFDYLAKSCTMIDLYQNTEDDIVFNHNMTRPITILNHPWPVYTQATNKMLMESQKNSILGRILNFLTGNPSNKGMVIYKLNIEWDFRPYTSTSLDFLLAYYHCKSDDFILSPYRHIIYAKWRRLYLYFALQALINWAHIILYCLVLLNTKNLGYFMADLVLLGIIFIYEIFCFVANLRHYFKDSWNYIDIINLVLCLVFLFGNYFSDTSLYEMHWLLLILQHSSLLLIGIRGFSFFRFIPQFSHITTMSAHMIRYSIIIIILISYCILCLSVILATTSLSDSLSENERKNHSFISDLNIMYDLLFGNLPSNWPVREDISIIYIIIIVISTMILPVFFMNLLIARLSSAYNASEQRQLAISLKQISFLIYEWEVLIKFVKKKIWKKEFDEQIDNVFLVVDKERLLTSEKSSFDDSMGQKMENLTNQTKQLRGDINGLLELLNPKLR